MPEHNGTHNSWAMDELTILHELAHFFTRHDPVGHGTQFCLCYLDLLELVISPVWRLLLVRALDQRGVPLS